MIAAQFIVAATANLPYRLSASGAAGATTLQGFSNRMLDTTVAIMRAQ
jgi:hypothetical protein